MKPAGYEVELSGDGKVFKLTGYDLFPSGDGLVRGVLKSQLGTFTDPAEALLMKGFYDDAYLTIVMPTWTPEKRSAVLEQVRVGLYADTETGRLLRDTLGIKDDEVSSDTNG